MASEIESKAAVVRGWFGFEGNYCPFTFINSAETPTQLDISQWSHYISVFVFYRAHIGRRPKTFWSWWCLAQPALLFQTMFNALIAQNHVALQKLPLHAFSITLPKSCLERPWTSILTSQRSVSASVSALSLRSLFSLLNTLMSVFLPVLYCLANWHHLTL